MAIKRVLCVILSLVILAGCLMVGTWAETEIDPKTDSVKTVYVSDGGSAENNGLTRETPVPYLNTAIKIINDAAAADPAIKQGKIVLVGDITPGVTSSYNFGELTQLDPYEIPLTITAETRADGDGKQRYSIILKLSGKTHGDAVRGLLIGGFTTFENIGLDMQNGRGVIYENCKGLIMGTNITVVTPSKTYISIGYQNVDASKTETKLGNSYIEVHSGSYNRLHLVPHYQGKYSMGNLTVIAENCTFTGTGIDMCTVNWAAGEYVVNGDINILLDNVSFTGSNGRVQLGLASDVQSYQINGNIFVRAVGLVGLGKQGNPVPVNFGKKVTFAEGCGLRVSRPDSIARYVSAPSGDDRVKAVGDLSCLPTLAGYQDNRAKSEGETYSARFVATIPMLDGLSKVGFEITPKIGDNSGVTQTVEGTTVYSSIQALDESVTATSLGGRYIYALEIKNIPVAITEVEYTVTPYVIDSNGNRVNGLTKTITVSAAS